MPRARARIKLATSYQNPTRGNNEQIKQNANLFGLEPEDTVRGLPLLEDGIGDGGRVTSRVVVLLVLLEGVGGAASSGSIGEGGDGGVSILGMGNKERFRVLGREFTVGI